MRRTLAAVMALTAVSGCSKQSIYGTAGSVVVRNTTQAAIEVTYDGRSTGELELKPGAGAVLTGLTPGLHTFVGGGETIAATVGKRGLTLISFGGNDCYARADIAGLYVTGKVPIRVLETYPARNLYEIPEEIHVLPGQEPPSRRQKSPFGFLRVVAVPCALLDNASELERVFRPRR